MSPIRPSERARYPKNWCEISATVRFGRAGSRCECRGECGQHLGQRCVRVHDELGISGRDGSWEVVAETDLGYYTDTGVHITRTILTVAHLDHTPENVDHDNLRAMCQRCHLRYDVDHHRETAILGRDARRGQGRLF